MTYNYTVNTPICALYNIPKSGTELADEALYGMSCAVIERQPGYAYIETFYKYRGWVSDKDIIPTPETNIGTRRMIITPFADILTEPRVQGGIIITLPRGAYINVTGSTDGMFVCVRTNSGKTGFTHSCNLADALPFGTEIKNETSLRDSLVESAERYLGVQYRWGGKTPAGIDCSGLCSSAYLQNGIIIWRDAKLVEGFLLKALEYEDLKRGDLVFAPGHVMMYMGNKKIIHSTSLKNGVVYGDLPPKESVTGAGSIFI